MPVGRFELFRFIASCTSEMLSPRDARATGFTCTRTAYFCEPLMFTCATPSMVDRRGTIKFCAYSSTLERSVVLEDSTRNSTGDSDGFTLRNEGGLGKSGGSRRSADEIADCTSSAA